VRTRRYYLLIGASMRKIILYIAASLDGFIARENGELDWLPGGTGELNQSEEDCGYEHFFDSIDTVLMGHKTYAQVLSFGIEYPYKTKQSFVFTRASSPPNADKNVTFINENAETFAKKLRNSPGKDIWLNGGAELISSFFEKNLVDELILFVIPTTIGKGIPLFPQTSVEKKLTLIESKSYDQGYAKGIVKLHYSVKNSTESFKE
jgi:dihydrofolate reductase